MVDEVTAAAGISLDTWHRILSEDLIMSRVTQHCVPRVLTQVRPDHVSCYPALCSMCPDRSDLIMSRVTQHCVPRVLTQVLPDHVSCYPALISTCPDTGPT
jgi:hypothetical protein